MLKHLASYSRSTDALPDLTLPFYFGFEPALHLVPGLCGFCGRESNPGLGTQADEPPNLPLKHQ